MSADFVDNSAQLLAAFRDACERGLWRCGEKAEEYAKDLAPVDTGNLRNSITHTEHAEAGGGEMHVGTDVDYAADARVKCLLRKHEAKRAKPLMRRRGALHGAKPCFISSCAESALHSKKVSFAE